MGTISQLTHWGFRYASVTKAIISVNNGLLPEWCQAII